MCVAALELRFKEKEIYILSCLDNIQQSILNLLYSPFPTETMCSYQHEP